MNTLIKFVLDGGLFGKMRGFDSTVEGRAYGMDEFIEDTTKLETSLDKVHEIGCSVKDSVAELLPSKKQILIGEIKK